MRRPTLVAALVYALLALAFVSPGLAPGRALAYSDAFWFFPPWSSRIPADLQRPANIEVADAPSQLYPFVQHAKAELPGDVPLWNPHIAGGRPFLANMQSQVFSAFTLPAYLLPFFDSLAWTALLKLFIAGFGTFLLARALGARFAGALLAGVVYAFNLWIVTWLVYPHASVWALIPLLLFAVDRAARRPDLLSGAGVAAVGGLQFLGGHPESSFHACLVAAAFFALRVVSLRRVGRAAPLRHQLAAFGGGLVGGALVAAVVLLPFVELLLRSADLEQRAGSAAESFTPRRYLLGFFLYDYWGRPTGTSVQLFLLARAFYAGALPLMLGALALIVRPSLERVAIAAFGAVCMAVVVGLPPVFELVTALPVLESGHNTRLVILAMLCLALLAGFGLDELVDGRRLASQRRAAIGVAAALLAAPLLVVIVGGKVSLDRLGDALEVAWGFATPPPATDPSAPDVIRTGSALVWLVVGLAALALFVLGARRTLRGTALAAGAVGLVALDLFRAGMGYNPAIDEDHASQPATGAIRYLEGRRPARFVSTGRTAEIPQNVIAMRFGLYEARGYDLPIERRYDRFWRREVSPEFPTQVGPTPANIPLALPRVTARRLRALSLLGVADVMQPPTDRPLRLPGLRPAYRGPDATVYANERALPRAWVVRAQRVVGSEDESLRAVTAAGFDPRRVAVTERRLPGLTNDLRAGSGGGARLFHYDAERITLDARAQGPGLLVLSDLHYPGWKATVDGRDAPIERVDYLFRGVALGPGRHRVELRYDPLSFRAGWIVSLLALAGVGAAVLLGRRSRRGTTASGPPSRTPAAGRTAPAPRP